MSIAAAPIELELAVSYAIFLALIAYALEKIARHVHLRSSRISTVGFTYHPVRDVWICSRDQHLFPIFSDSQRGKITYRASASVCNSCPSKAGCTDSNTGRKIEPMRDESVESGMVRFHRAFSLVLLSLAGSILAIELFRNHALIPRLLLGVMLLVLLAVGSRLSTTIRDSDPDHRTETASRW